MSTRKDFEAALRIVKNVQDLSIRRAQANLWADYFEADNAAFNRELFFYCFEQVGNR